MKDLKWVNIGLQQFHMCIGEPEDSVQSMPNGIVGLVFEDLEGVRCRLAENGVPLEVEPGDGRDACGSALQLVGPALRLRSPTGVQIRIHAGAEWFGPAGAKEAGCAQPGGPSAGLGMQYIEFMCPLGTSAGIARFYALTMGIPAEDLGGACRVSVSTGQFLLFRETSREMPAYDNHHIAIYIGDLARGDATESFSAMYQRCQKAGLVYNNPRFPELTYDTLEDALKRSEFRVLDLVDPDSKGTVYTLEHEIRALTHPGFSCKQLLRAPEPGQKVPGSAMLSAEEVGKVIGA